MVLSALIFALSLFAGIAFFSIYPLESLNKANVSMMDVITEGSQDGLHENKSKEFNIYDFPDGKIVNPEPSLKEKIDNSSKKESIDNVLGKNFDDFDD